MADFIATEPFGDAGESGELRVWEAVKRAFAERECLGYWRYPIFPSTGGARKEPDILLVDRELGLIIIEVKSLHIEQLESISGHRWDLRNFYTPTVNPYQQGERQLFALLRHCDGEPLLQGRVPGRVVVALPCIESEAWLERGFHALPSCPPLLFEDNLGKASLLRTVEDAPPAIRGARLGDKAYETLRHVVSGTSAYHKPPPQNRDALRGRGLLIRTAREKLHHFDLQQETIAKQIPPGPQRIRGVAGSGKTVLLCQKAAQMHLKHPDWDIALVFFTRSLYDIILAGLDYWLRYQGGVGYEPANSKLRVLHAWGAKTQPGFYRELAYAHRQRPLSAGEVPRGLNPTQSYAYVLKTFLETLESAGQSVQPLYDAILVDEGQDLVFEPRFTYQGQQPFYTLAYRSLRPVKAAAQAQALFAEAMKPESEDARRLIWAYDEAQSLDSLVVPNYKEVFGDEVSRVMLSGGVSYGGGIAKNEVMRRCYRTPGPVLTAAHAIGMGLLRPQGVLSGITTKEGWRRLGYEVEGDFRRPGAPITLYRPRESSPNLVPQLAGDTCLAFDIYPSRAAELSSVAKRLAQDIQDGLDPSRDLLVITLGNAYEAKGLQESLARALTAEGLSFFVPGATKANTTHAKYPDNDPNAFWHPGAVTLSPIYQAKGNEADVVYIVGFDHVAKQEASIPHRNQIFVALTRSRGWAHLSGVGRYPMFEEMERVIKAKTVLTFSFTKAPQRELVD